MKINSKQKKTLIGVVVSLVLVGLVTYAFLTNVLNQSGVSVQTVDGMKVALYTMPYGDFVPSPPKSGLNTIDIRLIEDNNRPVAGAKVEVEYGMDGMEGGGGFVAEADRSSGPGAYSGVANFGMAGSWKVRVKVSRQGEQEREAFYTLTVND